MRIITGKARGIRLETLTGETTRPTAERTKEAIFSALQFELEDRQVLDLFAGSGQLGLEALSRGAMHATFVDRDRRAAEIVRANIAKTRMGAQCEVIVSDSVAFLQSGHGARRFDLVFLDPPYALQLIPDVLHRLIKGRCLSAHATLVCESAAAKDVFGDDAELQDAFVVRKQTTYGAACVTLLEYQKEDR